MTQPAHSKWIFIYFFISSNSWLSLGKAVADPKINEDDFKKLKLNIIILGQDLSMIIDFYVVAIESEC